MTKIKGTKVDSYIEGILEDDEQVLHRSTPSLRWLLLLPIDVPLCVAILSPLWLIPALLALSGGKYASVGKWIAFGILGLVPLSIISAIFDHVTSERVLTNKRLIVKKRIGLFSREYEEILLHRIESIDFGRTRSDKILGIGSFAISGAKKQIALPNVVDPVKFRRTLDQAIQAAKDRQRSAHRRDRPNLRRVL